MEVYTFPQQGLKDAYTIPDTHSNSCFTSGSCQQFENMYSEGAPEYFLDQGLYYHSGTGYGYVCSGSGFESPCKWDDHHHSSFGLDGQDAYAGAQTDNFPFLYYSPSYGYGQSPYNPYNPYIPGAIVGADGQFLGAPHYYTISPYDNSSSPVYFPIPVHSKPELTGSNSTDETVDSNSSIASRAKGSVLKHNISSASSAFTSTLLGPTASNRANSFTKVSSGTESHAVTCRQPAKHGNVTSSTLSHPTSNQILQNGSAQALDYVARGKPVPSHAQLKATLPRSDGLSAVGSSIHGQHTGDKLPSKFLYERVLNDTKACCNGFTEQGRGPKMDKQRNQLTLKAYSSTAGNADAQGNVIIYIDQFNKDDIVTDYASAKFFVIKSYSEDDVHKSIKYGVWSSTANGNKKLNNAYEDAQRIAKKDSGSCPVFLFFSVNASGQFCGVAEMTGPVDFHRDMDFWQQDKWNGSFPVKWHIVKDVPNSSVRHITLENNENKPVTNSRDTQEVRHRRGVEMLKVFKNYVPKTSLFDDFMYYENREKILLEEKARLLIRSCDYPFLLPVLKHQQVSSVIDLPSKGDAETEPKRPTKSDKYVAESAQVGHLAGDASSTAANESSKRKNSANSGNDVAASAEMVCLAGTTNSSTSANESSTVVSEQAHSDAVSSMGTPATSSSKPESEVVPITVAKDSASTDVMTIGSMPVKVNGYADPCGFLRFGTVDATAFQHDKAGYVGKGGK